MPLGLLPPQVDQVPQAFGVGVGEVVALRPVVVEVIELPRLGVVVGALGVFADCLPAL